MDRPSISEAGVEPAKTATDLTSYLDCTQLSRQTGRVAPGVVWFAALWCMQYKLDAEK